MDATETTDLDYILGAVPTAPSPSPVPPPPPISLSTTTPQTSSVPTVPLPVPPVSASPTPQPPQSESPSTAANPKKRPLDDKKAREKKRILRNRELARVSNERRKGRIKAMEQELNDTRQTVTTLEESIRCLEAENKELRNLLTSKPGPDAADPSVAGAAAAAAAAAVSSVPQGLDPSVAADPSLPSSAGLAPQPPQP